MEDQETLSIEAEETIEDEKEGSLNMKRLKLENDDDNEEVLDELCRRRLANQMKMQTLARKKS